ncbi:MAG: FMN-dependent NADH-azoreductase [Gammaproteobacteria bacterium]|nr:MAG: FMN-dependent NADH-azoreductase [Gammaproteobacteria bacterium]
MNFKKHFLRIDASASVNTSNSKKLGDQLMGKLEALHPGAIVQQRDLNQGMSFIDESWVTANFTPVDQRSEEQQQRLALSDELIDEIRQADHIVLTTPMYNFGIPATLKTWIDLVCRAGVTFQYTADGPVGLIKGKRIDIIITTGGVPLQSPVDFVSDYLKQVFRFIGIEDINIIAADQMNVDADASYQNALDQIEQSYQLNSAA